MVCLILIFLRQHTAGQTERFQSKLVIKGTILNLGVLINPFHRPHCYNPHFPSPPGWTSKMQARGHLVGAIGSSRNHTISPTRMLRDEPGHLDSFLKLVRYSVDHRCQKCRTSTWHKCQCHNTVIEVAGDSVSSKASRRAPTRKCAGVRAPIPFFRMWEGRQRS